MKRAVKVLLAIAFGMTLGGCKGKLPKSFLSSAPAVGPSVSVPALVAGASVPPFDGEIVFGTDPKRGMQKDDVFIVTKNLGIESTPKFFSHFKLFPKVRWVQYVSNEVKKQVVDRTITMKKKGEVTEGLTLIAYDAKKSIPWRMTPRGDLHVIQNGVVVAQCFEKDLDRTVGEVLSDRFNAADSARKQAQRIAAWKSAEALWYKTATPYVEKQATFAQFRKSVIQDLDHISEPRCLSHYISNFLFQSGCRPLSEVEPVLKLATKHGSGANALRFDIDRHLLHSECRERTLFELKCAADTGRVKGHPDDYRALAKYALQIQEKKLAVKFLKVMLTCPELKPRYARAMRDIYVQDYESMMRSATI